MQLCYDVSPNEIDHFHGLDAQNKQYSHQYIQSIEDDVGDHADVDVLFSLNDMGKGDRTNGARNRHPRRPNVKQPKKGGMDRNRPETEARKSWQEVTAKIELLRNGSEEADHEKVENEGGGNDGGRIPSQIK